MSQPRPSRARLELLVLGILIGVTLTAAVPPAVAKLTNAYEFFDTIVDVRGEVMRNYVTELDGEKEEQMLDGAIQGMLETLDDPYTSYLSPDSLKAFHKVTSGTFSGIGAEITEQDGLIKIVTPLEDSPAYKAGILAGDVILEVNGTPVTGMSSEKAVDLITGPEGTQVVLKVRHTDQQEVELTITRGRIEIQTVKGFARDSEHRWRFMLDPDAGIGYVRLSQFSDPTADALRAAVAQMKTAGLKGMILDLRSNPGGLLSQAIDISDLFLDKGVIVSTEGHNSQKQSWEAGNGTTLGDFDIIVMVNEASASASEILAGALKDNDRAIVLGARTYGKGSVQQVKLVGRGAVKLTTAHYYLPSGRNLHRMPDADTWGVDPTDGFYVPMTTAQYVDMVEARREADILRENDGDDAPPTLTADWVQENWKDLQLAAALRAMHTRLVSGNWQPVGASDATLQAHMSQKSGLERQRDFLSERLAEVTEELQELERRIAAGETIEPADGQVESPSEVPQEILESERQKQLPAEIREEQ